MVENSPTITEKPEKKNKITNKHYRNFLDNKEMDIIITQEDMEQLVNSIPRVMDKALVILLYYTGCRPIEALKITGNDIKKDGSFVIIRCPASKNGLPRNIYLSYSLPLVKILYDYAKSVFPNIPMFFDNRGNYKRIVKNKAGFKEVTNITQKFYYRFIKWSRAWEFGPLPPYYLRHNRFTKWSIAGMSLNELQIKKGAKTIASVYPYVHSSKELGKKAARITR